ncbi:RNA polymerase sigma factor [Falsigemmobacter intermedius]|uniref:RNA polymerase sigma factor n=1 Tax=Falsigemmobacter intermedius TaxID=1553448 RepID=A0A3S3UFI7_9RHOB|nr:RNA polymerase sigma factor [Falsigemmobacter intermedius]RWY40565.1 RNA polymerase sigma factor [Falsigemmobacter intermedius]
MALDSDLGPASEEALLRLYANGDDQAARELARRFLPRVLAYGRRMLGDGDEAQDVAQEAMVRLWRIAPEWRSGEAQVSTWLWRVTANLCTDRLRRRRGGVALEDAPEPEDDAPSALQQMVEANRAAALEAALQKLPERQRQAVVLRHLEGLSNPEIAEVMAIGVEAVESLTARGKRALSALLSGQKQELGYEDDR